VLALLLVALSLALSNFAAAIGIGVTGVNARTRLRVGVIFGVFEGGMPVLGLLAGRGLAGVLGHATRWVGGGVLIATGGYALVQAWRGSPGAAVASPQGLGRLVVTSLALSIDNLAVGFALGTYRVPFALAAAVIGAVSITLSLGGLELGARVGRKAGQRGEIVGGVILIAVGGAIAAGIL
jgi:manganese efflux pump family protein